MGLGKGEWRDFSFCERMTRNRSNWKRIVLGEEEGHDAENVRITALE